MGKLVKVILVLAVLVAGVLLILQYSGNSKSNSANTAQAEKKPKDGMQVQEKYGFAPVDPGK
jgi:hypothetical protein